jgi:CheY-like chemotaxis protein
MIEQKLEQELEQRLSVLIVATDNEQRALLKALVDSTKVVRSVDACENFPVAETIRVVQDWLASGSFVHSNPDVILVDIPVDNDVFLLRAIELLQEKVPESAVFVIGSRNEFALGDMLRGASELIERPTTIEDLRNAFYRYHLTKLNQKITKLNQKMEELGRSLPWFYHG